MDLKAKDLQACESGEQFVKLFYESFDKRRHVVTKLYTDVSTLTWNGHQVKGQTNIAKFYDELPSSRHSVNNIDAQPLTSEITQGQTAIVVVTSGIVKYEDSRDKFFNQSFTLSAQDNKWKIVADSLRFAG